MNDLKDLVIALDGYSVDKTGFEIIEVYKGKEGFWNLSVKAYKKEGKDFSSESNVSMLTLVDRIENNYGTRNNKWTVVKAEELIPGGFELIVNKVGTSMSLPSLQQEALNLVKKATDEKEDSSDKEEHVEAEE